MFPLSAFKRLASSSSSVLPIRFFGTSSSSIKKYTITGESNSRCTKSTTLSGDPVVTDMPFSTGGTGLGGTPVEALLSALIGCEYLTSLYISKELGFTLNKVTHQLTAERNEEGVYFKPIDAKAPISAAVSKITGVVNVETNGTQEQLD